MMTCLLIIASISFRGGKGQGRAETQTFEN